jgi:hypothetical protein
MDRIRPRELQLAREEVLILLNGLDNSETQLEFLELHARAILAHIRDARPISCGYNGKIDVPPDIQSSARGY